MLTPPPQAKALSFPARCGPQATAGRERERAAGEQGLPELAFLMAPQQKLLCFPPFLPTPIDAQRGYRERKRKKGGSGGGRENRERARMVGLRCGRTFSVPFSVSRPLTAGSGRRHQVGVAAVHRATEHRARRSGWLPRCGLSIGKFFR